MSTLTLRGNAAGSGTFIVESPNSNISRTITLPDATTTLVGTDATQTLTNKTLNGGAITLGTVQASTSGTQIDFTGIPSWAKRVTVMFNGVSTSGTSPVQIQLGDSGGIETAGYDSVASYSNVATAFTTSTTGFICDASAVALAASIRRGAYVISLIDGTTFVGSGSIANFTTNITCACGGSKTLSAPLDRIRITTVGGTDTFDAGTINIMWEG